MRPPPPEAAGAACIMNNVETTKFSYNNTQEKYYFYRYFPKKQNYSARVLISQVPNSAVIFSRSLYFEKIIANIYAVGII
jgi:hypothetical protein